jgi:mRNA interferase RelE/StbE
VASYRLLIKPSAAKELEALPRRDRKRVVDRIARLASDPRPSESEKLSGHDQYRVRQGDFRVVDTIDDAASVLIVAKIGHRRDVYR